VGAAAGQAEGPGRTSRIAGQTAFLLADRAAIAARATAPREAVCRDGVFAKTELTAFAGIQAIGRGRAGPAQSWVADVGQGARSVAPCVRAEEDVSTAELRESAASEAIAAVRRESATTFLTALRLNVGTIVGITEQVRVVGALILGLERIALAIPFALAVTRPVSSVEVAIDAALISCFTGRSSQQNWIFGVVARPEAFGIFVVDEAIAVIVEAIPASVVVPILTKRPEAALAHPGAADACARIAVRAIRRKHVAA
jgi:hypothetical protein